MERKLNIKKVVIAILILLLLVVSIVVFVISRVTAKPSEEEIEKIEEEQKTTVVFTDTEGTVSIEVPKKYNLEQSHNSEYLIKASSKENLDIYISKITDFPGRDLYSVARADKMAYLEAYNSYSNLADLKELEVNGNRAYTYSFHYLDENMQKAFYIQVVLLQIGDDIYVFDIDFPLDDLVLYTQVTEETLASFMILN